MPARKVDLEPHRDWIVSQINSGRTLEYIRGHLPVRGPSVSECTLRRRLDAWGVRNSEMGQHGERRATRREGGLEQAKPWILDAYRRSVPTKTIRSEIQRRLGVSISERRLHQLLHTQWGVTPRRELAAAPQVRELITTLANGGMSVAQIRHSLEVELEIRRSRPWVCKQLQSWGIQPPKLWNVVRLDDADVPAIMDYIERQFFKVKQKDADLKEQLQDMGYIVTLKQIFEFRSQMGLFRKLRPAQADDSYDRLREALSSSPRADLLVPRLTKKLLPLFFKREFHIPVSRTLAWRYVNEHYPAEMLERVRVMARRRAGFLCPGPNYIWSIDAYCKLAHWGIEVYACIDAYSRCIIWAHVGHSAQTQRSVCLQYVDTIRKSNFLPMVIRSDHGVETGMIAGAHYWLSAASTEGRLLKPTRDEDQNVVWIYRENVNGQEVRHVVRAGEDQDAPPPTYGPWRQLEFQECYSYGLSTKNQRIESWWQELNFHITGYWREFFTFLEKEQEWSEFRIADRIALLYIYLPQIHWEIGKFLEMWNCHYIRAQRNRPHVVPGIPLNNYGGRDTQARVNCAVAVNRDSLARLEEALEYDRQNVSVFLSQDMMVLCESMMATLDVDAIPPRNYNRPLISEYRHLRACLQYHEGRQVSPLLHLAEKPTGGWPALDAVVQETGRSLVDILGEEIDDGFDPGLDL